MNKIDLHVHSKYSNDGEFEIKELINKCLNNKIEVLSITDHNSTLAIQEAIPLCLNTSIDIIGVMNKAEIIAGHPKRFTIFKFQNVPKDKYIKEIPPPKIKDNAKELRIKYIDLLESLDM